MEINHHVSITVDSQLKKEFEMIGFPLKMWEAPYEKNSTFDIYESDPRWQTIIKASAKDNNVVDVAWTLFSDQELLQVEAVGLDTPWQNGYPQPTDTYKNIVYDLTDYCATCGTGLLQKAPFRLKKEPSWGRRSIFKLFTDTSQFFVKLEDWRPVIEEFKLPIEVVHDKKANVMEGVVQLKVEEIVDVDITPNLQFSRCQTCERLRYRMISRGPLPPPKQIPLSHIFKSKQYFGSGHMAYRQIMISNELYRAIKKLKLQRFTFSVCAPYPPELGDPSNGYA